MFLPKPCIHGIISIEINKRKDDQMAIRITTVRNKLEEAKEDLFNFVTDFDGDLSGQNGEEFTSDEALEAGFECTMEYFLSESAKETTTVESFIEHVMEKVERTYSGYDFAAFEISELDESQFIVAFAHSEA